MHGRSFGRLVGRGGGMHRERRKQFSSYASLLKDISIEKKRAAKKGSYRTKLRTYVASIFFIHILFQESRGKSFSGIAIHEIVV